MTSGVELTAEVMQRAHQELQSSFDSRWGGFGMAPKFPTPHNLRPLLRMWHRTREARTLAMAVDSLRAMRRGGIWDHVGFGYHRYSTDRQWLLPHFEKMLYDQALISMIARIAPFAAELGPSGERATLYLCRDFACELPTHDIGRVVDALGGKPGQ